MRLWIHQGINQTYGVIDFGNKHLAKRLHNLNVGWPLFFLWNTLLRVMRRDLLLMCTIMNCTRCSCGQLFIWSGLNEKTIIKRKLSTCTCDSGAKCWTWFAFGWFGINGGKAIICGIYSSTLTSMISWKVFSLTKVFQWN